MTKYIYSNAWKMRNNSENIKIVLNSKKCRKKGSDVTEKWNNSCYCQGKKIPPLLFLKPKVCACHVRHSNERKEVGEKKQMTNIKNNFTKTQIKEMILEDENEGKLLDDKKESYPFYQIVQRKRGQNEENYTVETDQEKGRSRFQRRLLDTNLFGSVDSEKSVENANFIGVKDQKHFYIEDEDASDHKSVKSYDKEEDKIDNSKQYPSFVSEGYENSLKTLFTQTRKEKEAKKDRLSKHYPVLGIEDNESWYPKTSSEELGNNIVTENTNFEDETEDIKKLSTFRKDHYFETHSTEDFSKFIPAHTCIHKFNLDNRLLPFPLNQDVFGESRCIICNKPISNLRKFPGENAEKILPTYYKYGLAPKKVFISPDNVKLSVELEDWRLPNPEKYKTKSPNYHNTYALRYQRGVK